MRSAYAVWVAQQNFIHFLLFLPLARSLPVRLKRFLPNCASEKRKSLVLTMIYRNASTLLYLFSGVQPQQKKNTHFSTHVCVSNKHFRPVQPGQNKFQISYENVQLLACSRKGKYENGIETCKFRGKTIDFCKQLLQFHVAKKRAGLANIPNNKRRMVVMMGV